MYDHQTVLLYTLFAGIYDSTTASLETLDSRTTSLAASSSTGLEEKDPTATHTQDSQSDMLQP